MGVGLLVSAAAVVSAAGFDSPASGAGPTAPGDRQQVAYGFTTSEPATPTGTDLRIDWVNPLEPGGKPPAVARIELIGPEGSQFDTSVAPRCSATDAELIALGTAACPPASRIGGGSLITDNGAPAGFPRLTPNVVTNFNGDGELIGLAETQAPPTRVVSRSRVEGRTLTIEVPAAPGAPPPDPYLAFKTLAIETEARVGARGASLSTPPACPAGGSWTATLRFTYRDGVQQTEEVSLPCKGAGQARKCQGKPADVVGSRRGERLVGTRRRDVILALGGNDRIRGLGGNDRICAGGGEDQIRGGRGRDRIRGGRGSDVFRGAADDRIRR